MSILPSQPLFKPQETCLISGTEFDGEQCQVIKQYIYFADALDPQKTVLDDWNGDAIMCYNQLNEALKSNARTA
jgi:hypothetical protein